MLLLLSYSMSDWNCPRRVISLDQAEQAYKDFDAGEAAKYIIDPHGMLA